MRRKGSPPAMAPMILELTARPAQPQVMTKPMAVPVMRGKAVPTMARVVGKTGAMERPAMKTKAAAATGLTVLEHEQRGDGHGDRGGQEDLNCGDADEDGRDADAADEEAESESEGKDVEGAGLWNALGDEVAREPVPHADFAGDVEEEEGSEEEEQGAAEDGAGVGEDEARGCRGCGHGGDDLHHEGDDGERGDAVAEVEPIPLEDVGGDEGGGEAAETKEEIDEVECGGAVVGRDGADQRIGSGDDDAAADAEQEEQKDDAAKATERGRTKRAITMNARPRMRPILSP